MGLAGPRPRSKAAQKLRGFGKPRTTKRGRKKNADRAQRAKSPPPVDPADDFPGPQWLGPIARQKWLEIYGPSVRRLGLVPELDQDLLALYCDAWQQFMDADAAIRKSGASFKTRTGYVAPHPAVKQREKACTLIRRLASDLGLSVQSRRGLDTAPAEDELDDFLKG